MNTNKHLLMSAVTSPPLIYSGALLLLSFCAFRLRWLRPYSISDLMGANVTMNTELLTLFLYVAILSSIVVYSLRLMATCNYSKGVDDSGAKEHTRFHDDQEEMTMGADEENLHQDDIILCCSSCGVSKDEDTHFKPCDACDLVQYCSDDCQKEHRAEHEESCKERAAELHDKILFQQPESTYLGDCAICLLPILDTSTCVMESCCSAFICDGCSYANRQRELEDGLDQRCPFCRATPPATYEEGYAKKMKRVEANDPVALDEVGKKHYSFCHDSASCPLHRGQLDRSPQPSSSFSPLLLH